MDKRNDFLDWLIVTGVALAIGFGGIYLHRTYYKSKTDQPLPKINQEQPQPPLPEPPKTPKIPTITTPIPAFLQYSGVINQIKKWNQEATDLTEIQTYGKSRQGKDLYYIRITNKLDMQPKPVILVHACIHGNEPHATTSVMAYIGTMLSTYSKDEEVTKLINTRDFYFVPVMCPDSYPNSRHIDGVDPNRDYPGPSRPNHTSTPCVQAMQDLTNKIKPKAVISGHTFGRIFLTPWGDQNPVCPNEADYQRIVGKMAQMCQYRKDRACNMYGTPIHGSELDWYYRKGAFSLVIEFGTHQNPPSQQEIQSEFQRTYKSVLYFFQDAPQVNVTPKIIWKFPQLLPSID